MWRRPKEKKWFFCVGVLKMPRTKNNTKELGLCVSCKKACTQADKKKADLFHCGICGMVEHVACSGAAKNARDWHYREYTMDDACGRCDPPPTNDQRANDLAAVNPVPESFFNAYKQ